LSRVNSSQVSPQQRLNWSQFYFGVGFTTLATLILELSLTRIFSVVFYYHFAFLAISIALFGLGAGGVFSYVVAGWRMNLFTKLGTLALANGVIVVGSVSYLLSQREEPTNITLAIVYLVSALPFFVAGAIISLAISESIEKIDRVYFFDLLGAAAGCLLLIPLLDAVGGPNTVIAAAIVFTISAAIWFNLAGHGTLRATAVVVSLALLSLIFVNAKRHYIDIKFAKGKEIVNEQFTQWNSFSRIAVAPERPGGPNLIIIDADASTGIANFNFETMDDQTRSALINDGPGFPYAIRPGAKTLIIGPGGGWDVSRALASGSKDVTGVEINPIIARTVMRDKLPQLSNNIYKRPEVKIHVEDGRSFVRRSTEKYQVIQATLVDTWASTAAGAFALSENNLYTSDAFYDYLSHLTDDGVLAFTRWGFEPPRESLRLLSLAMDALARLGETAPSRHFMVVRQNTAIINQWGATDTVLISRKPFTAEDVDRARATAAQSRMDVVYLPGDKPVNAFGRLLKATDLDQFYRDYEFDIRPVDDDQPFFFYTVQPRDLLAFWTSTDKQAADYKINRAVPMLFSLMGISLFATALILVLPRLVLGSRLPKEKGVVRFLFYFLGVGVGYILIQVALIQKFVLFLGHPTYALIVIVFSMLVASSLGSFYSKRFIAGDPVKWRNVLVAVPVFITILAFAAAPVTTALVGLPLAVKMIITVLLIAPVAFLMGIPFPTGLARLEEMHAPSVRWAWAINAASSVLGSASAIFLAIYIGLRATLIIGGLCYVIALLTRATVNRRSTAV
jgi:spermidine synthase